MKKYIIVFLFFCYGNIQAKEWRSLKCYKKETQLETLSASDWLKKDRTKNTIVWQKANVYNLSNNLPQEYETIKQRRDFYLWYSAEIAKKGHYVTWPTMAYYINKKLNLTNTFPFSLFVSKNIKQYAINGSEDVFNNCFVNLYALFKNKKPLTKIETQNWDEHILYMEQYKWLESIYKNMPERTLNTIERMAKRKCLYALVVPKEIKFKGDISKAESRYNYALNTLKVYCKKKYNLK